MTQDEINSNETELAAELFSEEDDASSLFLVSNSGVKYSMHLFKTISEIAVLIRSHSAFAKANIMHLGDLVTKKYSELISMPDLGRKSSESVKSSIANLRLGSRAIPYLAPGNYLGIEKEAELLRAGLEQELGADHAYFAYTDAEIVSFGEANGFRCELIGDWGHPRGQVMAAYRQTP